MKKLFITIISMLLPMMAMGQMAEVDFTKVTEFTGWTQFDDSQTDGKVELTPEGLAITVGIQTGNLWQPQIMVIPDGSFNLEEDGDYVVVVTAKFPTYGTLQINMGTWGANDQAQFPVEATGDFQEVVCEFHGWSVNAEGAHLLFHPGDFKGTTILKKIQVFEMEKFVYPVSDICFNFIDKGKVAEVIPNSDGEYKGIVEIPSIVIHDGEEYTVTKIVDYAFQNCTNLTSVTIPNSVTSIGQSVFSYCSGLTTITIPNSVTSIGSSAFHNCSGLTSITIPNSVTSIESYVFSGCSGLASITIPNSVTSIGDYAFADCSGLISVTIPNSVTNIGSNSFESCSGLTSITIPNSVTYIGNSAFSACIGLTSITIPNSMTSIAGYAFADCSGLTSITIPNSVTIIGYNAFADCSGLTSVTIPNSVTSIVGSAFSGCSGLTSITIPNSVTSIGSNAFAGCSGLTSITIPNNVTNIDGGAFSGCSGLTTITIGNGTKTIYEDAFSQCPDLRDVYCLAENVPYTRSNVFEGSYIEYATLHVPESAINAYKTTEPWSRFGKFVTLSGEEAETPKCATPTISFEGGKIKFSCETEGVEYVSEISSVDAGNKYTDEVEITGKITVKVYATKSGYENSETATAVIEVPGELKGDLNKDGTVNVADHVELTKIIMNEE